jgi:hypothetical protein
MTCPRCGADRHPSGAGEEDAMTFEDWKKPYEGTPATWTTVEVAWLRAKTDMREEAAKEADDADRWSRISEKIRVLPVE